jgi:SAM-dependent methyltransferase
MGSTSSPSSAERPYDTLASVYDWLVPDELLEPAGAVAAFSPVVERLAPGARVLDCAAGTGQLAVGLALRGFEVTASDASGAMAERTRALAERHGAALRTLTCTWEELPRRDLGAPFDAVLCVGNSLAHAAGSAGRRAALAAMAAVLGEGGRLAITSRNWELLRAARPGLDVADRLVERDGRRALVIRCWTWAGGWDDPHGLDVAVAELGGDGERSGGEPSGRDGIATSSERLVFWPFTHVTLQQELRGAGLEPESSTYAPDAERYLVTACRAPGAGAGAGRPRPAT